MPHELDEDAGLLDRARNLHFSVPDEQQEEMNLHTGTPPLIGGRGLLSSGTTTLRSLGAVIGGQTLQNEVLSGDSAVGSTVDRYTPGGEESTDWGAVAVVVAVFVVLVGFIQAFAGGLGEGVAS